MYKAVIFGVNGHKLTAEEESFFKKEKPAGFILFSRNIKDKKQLKELVYSLKETIDNINAPILIDQEGGRVARLKEPNWYHPPAAAVFGGIARKNLRDAKEACRINAQILGYDLSEMGINVDCAPLVDIPIKGSNNVIGDRAFSNDITITIELAKSMIEGLSKSGITHIVKHIPGHGRSMLDSHFELPHIGTDIKTLEQTDFLPFIALNKSRWAMTAHIVYKNIDPSHPATHSKKVIDLVREKIGFKGIIVTDCITMKALKGTPEYNAKQAFNSGCDLVMFSRPNISEMKSIISIAPEIKIDDLNLEKQRNLKKDVVKNLYAELKSLMSKYKIQNTSIDIDPTEQHF
ncbi:MAG: beta-N-acetylhexosaminidase [Alphaproteobacteria bacterium]|nr:beta-N-acetylhexosaminidase [Alphaproteobacteria bacterium]